MEQTHPPLQRRWRLQRPLYAIASSSDVAALEKQAHDMSMKLYTELWSLKGFLEIRVSIPYVSSPCKA